MRLTAVLGFVLAGLLAGCSRGDAPPPSGGTGAAASAAKEPAPRYGAVMAEAGRRFELAGKAVNAGRFELAAFEVEELGELFEEDLPRAELPKEGPTESLPGLADAFLKTHPPELKKAADAKDRAAFTTAFQRAAETCNACHKASGHGFIEVPSVPGKAVPDIDPPAAGGAQ